MQSNAISATIYLDSIGGFYKSSGYSYLIKKHA